MGPIEAIEEAIEEEFPPKPGGLVDRHRRKMEERKADEQERINAAERVEQSSYKAVKVAVEAPEVFAPVTFAIPAGGRMRILSGQPYRLHATVLVATAASTVLICKDENSAVSQNGFILPTGLPLPVFARAELWAYNNSGAAVQVSVIAELYAPEKK